MSLINQVLNDLEQRGAGALPDEPVIRPVSAPGNRRNKMILPAAGVLLLLFAAAGLWWRQTQRKPALPESMAPIITAQAPAQEIPQNSHEIGAPASRLSFELSSIPSALRAKPVQAKMSAASSANPNPATASEQSRNKTAAPSPAATGNRVQAAQPAALPPGSVDKQIKQVSPQQRADNEFRRANGLMQQGRSAEAIAGYEAALQLDADHDAARQAMVGLLLESKRNTDAERLLQEGLKRHPQHSGFAMLLARLQVERNELALALETLQKTLPYAERQADYQAFVAALLQRQGQHKEAVTHYQTALQLSPGSGIWLMGLGISLQALQRNEEARNAFSRALESRTLNAELQAFVSQRLKEL